MQSRRTLPGFVQCCTINAGILKLIVLYAELLLALPDTRTQPIYRVAVLVTDIAVTIELSLVRHSLLRACSCMGIYTVIE